MYSSIAFCGAICVSSMKNYMFREMMVYHSESTSFEDQGPICPIETANIRNKLIIFCL